MLNFYFKPVKFVKNLRYMGIGMLGVFIIVGVIMAATYLTGYFTDKLKQSKSDN